MPELSNQSGIAPKVDDADKAAWSTPDFDVLDIDKTATNPIFTANYDATYSWS